MVGWYQGVINEWVVTIKGALLFSVYGINRNINQSYSINLGGGVRLTHRMCKYSHVHVCDQDKNSSINIGVWPYPSKNFHG